MFVRLWAMRPAESPGSVARGVARPRTGGVVSRPGLWERLRGSARVTVLSAPPGSGKTVLLRSWISRTGVGERAAWVLVGRDERDAQGFWLSVLGALRQTVPGSALVRALTAMPDLDGWAIVEWLLKDLLERRARQRTAHAALIAQILDLLAGPEGYGGWGRRPGW